MASQRMGVFALASACLAASLAWNGVPAIASNSQAAPATSTSGDETIGSGTGTDGESAESSTPVPESSPSPSPSPSLSPSPSPGSSPASTPESPGTPEDPESSQASAESPSESPSPTDSPLTSNDDVDDYIVVVRNEAYIDSIKSKAEDLGGESDKELRGAVDGFTAALTPLDVNELRADPNVRYIEPDALIELDSATFRTVKKTTTNNLSSCDDCSSPSLSLGFTLDWFGTQYTNIFINTNGGAVLDDGLGSFRSYRNFDLRTATRPYILPLFTDLNPAANGTVEFGQGTISDGSPKNVFWAEWVDVAEYGNNSARQEFQMLIIEEPDGATIEFRYVDLTNAGSTTNSVFEVGFADPTDSNNTVRIPDSNGDPSASELLSGQFGGSTGIWSYGVGDSGSPSPAPTPTPTPTPINSIQPDPPWGLDRIDQRSLPLNSTFSPAGNGSGVTVYVIDTGINTTHTEYASRVVAGYDFVDNDSDPSDCDGHGTHVAGTAVGSTYGVAKAASVSGVRVLNCYGNGYTSDVVAGMNWVRTNHSSGDAVVNMSLGGGGSKSIDDAVAALTSANITVVVAAGNSNDDAQYYSPARAATAITVGSTTSTDARSSFSNYGSTVDIFAPGSSILSAWYTSNTASNTLNGTSMASPHVAGAAAVYLGLNPGSTPAQVASALTSVSTTDAVTSAGSGSPDRLLYVADFSSGGGSAGGGGGGGGAGGGGGGSPSGGGSSGGDSSDDGDTGGGGLNAVTKIVPSAAGPPGSQIALAGWGLETTRAVTFNDVNASFSVVHGGHVNVTVPDLPPGTYVVHAVLAPTVGRASFWDGFTVHASATPSSDPSPQTPVDVPVPDTPTSEPEASAEFLSFSGKKSALSKATRSKLANLVKTYSGQEVDAALIAYTNAKSTKAADRRAKKRASKIQRYLAKIGFDGDVSASVVSAGSKIQRRGAIVYFAPKAALRDVDPDAVTSLIVRTKKGKSPTVDGQVRGSQYLPPGLGSSLTVDRDLGLRMYRVTFVEPVSAATAQRVSSALARDPGIAFSEIDALVSTMTTASSSSIKG